MQIAPILIIVYVKRTKSKMPYLLSIYWISAYFSHVLLKIFAEIQLFFQ